MLEIRGKAVILGTAFIAGVAFFWLFMWHQAVSRKAEAVIAETQRIQNQSKNDSAGKEAPGEQKEIPPPNLDRKVVVTAALTPEAKAADIARIADLTKKIKDGDGDLGDWLELGVYRKTIGDLDGAEEIWSYLAVTNSSDGISLANLANLYLYDRKDPKKAEEYLLAAIARSPHQVSYYETAYELYHFVLKDDAKGKEVVMKGLLGNPGLADAFKGILSRF